jgi:polyisoprenoid-binding protein YceI
VRRPIVKVLVALPVVAVALAVGGAWFYTHVVEGDPPARLALATASPTAGATAAVSTATAAPGSADGTWTATRDSQVGYRVKEVLFGQDATAVGRTNDVTGTLAISGTAVTKADFEVRMASVASDRRQRDNQFRNRILSVDEFPMASFALTAPIRLGAVPAEGVTVTAQAAGRLTLRGQTRDVTFTVQARRTGGRIEVSGSIHVVFADWGIPDPSFGPAQVGDNGELEFLLVFAK